MTQCMVLVLNNTGEKVKLDKEDWETAKYCKWYRRGFRILNGAGVEIRDYLGMINLINKSNNIFDLRRAMLKFSLEDYKLEILEHAHDVSLRDKYNKAFPLEDLEV